MAEPSSQHRPRSTTLVIAFAAAIVIAGLFVAGFLVGNASKSTSATTSTTSSGSVPGSGAGTSTNGSTGALTSPPGAVCQASGSACAITSGASYTVVAGTPFSFTVTTAGPPTPRIRKVGRLPKGVHFVNNHNGTATLFGTPISTARKSAVGTYPFTLTAIFSKGASTHVVTQTFTLTVTG